MSEKTKLNASRVDATWIDVSKNIKPESLFPEDYDEAKILPPTDAIKKLSLESPALGATMEKLFDKFREIGKVVVAKVRATDGGLSTVEAESEENLEKLLGDLYRLQIEFCFITYSYINLISQPVKKKQKGAFGQAIEIEINRMKKNEGVLVLLNSLHIYIDNFLWRQKEAILILKRRIEEQDATSKQLREIHRTAFTDLLAEKKFSFIEEEQDDKAGKDKA